MKNSIIYSLKKAFRDGNGKGCGKYKSLRDCQENPLAISVLTLWLFPILKTPLQYLLILLIAFLMMGCGNYPKDPEKTLEKVKNGTLLVGYSENPPWVVETDSVPAGIEPELVKAFAKTLHAKVEWRNDTEQNLFEDLEKKKLHLVIAGITEDTPWKKKVGLTRPFAEQHKKKHVLAAIRGENAFIVHLERFLYGQEQEIKARIKQ